MADQPDFTIQSLLCPSCGAHMELDKKQGRLSCPYCGHEKVIEKKDYQKIEYDRIMGRARAEEEIQRRRKREIKRPKIIALIVAAVLISIGILINLMKEDSALHKAVFPTQADPFVGLSVSFYGEDGSGYVSLSNSNGELYFVNFRANPEKGLHNGDNVVVSADKVSGYLWEPKEKTFTVSGLTFYIQSLSELPEQELGKIHSNTERLLREEWDKIVESGEAVGYKLTPYRQFLFIKSLPRPENALYDAYVTQVTRADGSVLTVYEVCLYEELKIKEDGILVAEYYRLQGFNLGYYYGFSTSSSFSGWMDADEMEAALRSVRDDFTLVS